MAKLSHAFGTAAEATACMATVHAGRVTQDWTFGACGTPDAHREGRWKRAGHGAHLQCIGRLQRLRTPVAQRLQGSRTQRRSGRCYSCSCVSAFVQYHADITPSNHPLVACGPPAAAGSICLLRPAKCQNSTLSHLQHLLTAATSEKLWGN